MIVIVMGGVRIRIRTWRMNGFVFVRGVGVGVGVDLGVMCGFV